MRLSLMYVLASRSLTSVLTNKLQTPKYDDEFDVIVVGSGAGGLTTAVTATISGNQKVLVAVKNGFIWRHYSIFWRSDMGSYESGFIGTGILRFARTG